MILLLEATIRVALILGVALACRDAPPPSVGVAETSCALGRAGLRGRRAAVHASRCRHGTCRSPSSASASPVARRWPSHTRPHRRRRRVSAPRKCSRRAARDRARDSPRLAGRRRVGSRDVGDRCRRPAAACVERKTNHRGCLGRGSRNDATEATSSPRPCGSSKVATRVFSSSGASGAHSVAADARAGMDRGARAPGALSRAGARPAWRLGDPVARRACARRLLVQSAHLARVRATATGKRAGVRRRRAQ